jgi:hypothetical protein
MDCFSFKRTHVVSDCYTVAEAYLTGYSNMLISYGYIITLLITRWYVTSCDSD